MIALTPGEITEIINIEQDNKKYLLTIKINEDEMNFIIFDKEEKNNTFSRKITLKNLKGETEQLFLGIKSCKEFNIY